MNSKSVGEVGGVVGVVGVVVRGWSGGWVEGGLKVG